jgi:hypothetical protein
MNEEVTKTKIDLPTYEHEATMKIKHTSAENIRKEREPTEAQTNAQPRR